MRKPYVSGHFYPSNPDALRDKIAWAFTHWNGPGYIPEIKKIAPQQGIIAPHAGYDYSGPVAAFSFGSLANSGRYDFFVVIGPNHTGLGSAISIGNEDYLTPLGVARVRKKAIDEIQDDLIVVDNLAHAEEHSVEVEIPFLQYIYGDVEIVPIVMMDQSLEAAEHLATRLRRLSGNFTIVASSDLNHYLPLPRLRKLDGYFSSAVLNRDIKAIYRYEYSGEISACGFGPIVTLLSTYSGKVDLLKLSNSIEITGGETGVGYASFTVGRV
ncbi:MAG: AmmeMemoRadiSam system protein B [Thermoplasmatales archaeon]|jgi:AmmeMemoRadiSam system protein B|nr:AmmeMemoRadiSam system protein B [Candidatus Thermoplasmatota archaeon]MCL6002027.1 AmmeMemoRadiSam system protein B [Candidatus Thermoplasmatota archaeon]MDA8055054.1 AmmeMemoRadiSam system protein B [Thermoplasmatales archaeon]